MIRQVNTLKCFKLNQTMKINHKLILLLTIKPNLTVLILL